MDAKPGTLYVVATPIGNLSDMSPRAVETLKSAGLIAAEDTRNSMRLLNRFDIHTPITSYHEFNRFDKARELISKLKQGTDIALITDAGTPLISDPGETLVAMCIEEGIRVSGVPGPVAAVNALVVSGFSTGRFVFEGFLTRKSRKLRDETLRRLSGETATIILYEAPHHLNETLRDLKEALGEERRIVLAREMTKLHEEIIRGTIGELIDTEPRGEYVLVIEGKESSPESEDTYGALTLKEHMQIYLSKGLDEKEALRAVARDRGVPRREIYNALKR